MQQNATSQSSEPKLEPKQARALEHLLAGASVKEAALAARVDRSTLHRWLRKDFGFQAALNATQRDLQREVGARLLHLARAASETVARAVEEGDLRAALAVLKGIGALPGTPAAIAAEDPAELEAEAKRAELDLAFRLPRFR